MKTIVLSAAALTLVAAVSIPVQAQQAGDQAAATQSGGPCAISEAMMAAVAENKQRHMAATRAKIDLVIDAALASPQPAKTANSPVIMGKGAPNG